MQQQYLTPRNLPRLLSLSIFLFSFLLYQNTVPNDYALDDTIYYKDNKFVQQGFKGIKGIFTKSTYFGWNGKNDKIYRPLPVACFAVQHSLHGNNPHFNHFVNVCLYALCCSLLLFLLRRLMPGVPLAIPFCITLLFTAHPIHTEAVANIKGLDEILAFLFFILTLHFLLCHIDRKKPGIHAGFLAASVASFLLCLLCKEHGLTLLGILPLALFTFRPLPVNKIVLLMVPFCCAALFYLVFRNILLDDFTFGEPLLVIQNTLMAADNRADQFATAFLILGKYLRLLFVPYPLCWDYSYNQIPITSWADPKAMLSLITYAGMLAAGVIGMRKKHILAFAALFFLLSFALSSNLFVKIGVTLGERLLFTPSLAFCMAMVFVFSKAAGRTRFHKPLAAAIMAAVIALYSVVIVNRNADWKNNYTLLSGDIVKNAKSANAHSGLGSLLLSMSGLEKDPGKKTELLRQATAELRQCVAIYPYYASAWSKLGDALNEAGRPDSAITAYRKALEIEPRKVSAINNLGTFYFMQKRYDSAARYFEKALSLDSNYATAHLNLGAVNLLWGSYCAAIASYEKAKGLDPRNQAASDKLHLLSLLTKDTALARQYRAAAGYLDPAADK
jgi:tetratricopeptide (TPR) repeat protein